MRVTKESSDAEALDGEGNCKDIKTVKVKDKITISRFLDCALFSSNSKKLLVCAAQSRFKMELRLTAARILWR